MEVIAWVLVGVLLAMLVTRLRSGNAGRRRRRRTSGVMPVLAPVRVDGVCCCVPPHPHHRRR